MNLQELQSLVARGESETEDIVNHIHLKVEPPAFPDIETIALSSGMAALALRISGAKGALRVIVRRL
jgi:hypothetical protein